MSNHDIEKAAMEIHEQAKLWAAEADKNRAVALEYEGRPVTGGPGGRRVEFNDMLDAVGGEPCELRGEAAQYAHAALLAEARMESLDEAIKILDGTTG